MPATLASGPAEIIPTNPPRIAALAHSGNSRFAWRASRTQPASAQTSVADDRPDDVDRQPHDRQDRGRTAEQDEPLDDEHDGATDEQPDEQPSAPQPADGRPECEGRDETGQPQADVEVGQRARSDLTEDERVRADLADAAGGLDDGEQRGHPPDEAGLLGPDRQQVPEPGHGGAGRGGAGRPWVSTLEAIVGCYPCTDPRARPAGRPPAARLHPGGWCDAPRCAKLGPMTPALTDAQRRTHTWPR